MQSGRTARLHHPAQCAVEWIKPFLLSIQRFSKCWWKGFSMIESLDEVNPFLSSSSSRRPRRPSVRQPRPPPTYIHIRSTFCFTLYIPSRIISIWYFNRTHILLSQYTFFIILLSLPSLSRTRGFIISSGTAAAAARQGRSVGINDPLFFRFRLPAPAHPVFCFVFYRFKTLVFDHPLSQSPIDNVVI